MKEEEEEERNLSDATTETHAFKDLMKG